MEIHSTAIIMQKIIKATNQQTDPEMFRTA